MRKLLTLIFALICAPSFAAYQFYNGAFYNSTNGHTYYAVPPTYPPGVNTFTPTSTFTPTNTFTPTATATPTWTTVIYPANRAATFSGGLAVGFGPTFTPTPTFTPITVGITSMSLLQQMPTGTLTPEPTVAASTWTTTWLNVQVNNSIPGSSVSLSNWPTSSAPSTITLVAGTYATSVNLFGQIANGGGVLYCRLLDVTHSTILATSGPIYNVNSSSIYAVVPLNTSFVLGSTSSICLQVWANNTFQWSSTVANRPSDAPWLSASLFIQTTQ